MFFKKALVDLLDGLFLGKNSTSVGLQMVVVIVASVKVNSVVGSRWGNGMNALGHRRRAVGASRCLDFGHDLQALSGRDRPVDSVYGPVR